MTSGSSHAASGGSLFGNLPVGRSAAVRGLLVGGGLVTAACVLWMQQLRTTGDTGGLAPIFFVLFCFYDYIAAMLALGTLVAALFVPRQRFEGGLLRWLGSHPVAIAAAVTVLFSLGTLFVYRNQPLSMDEYAPYFQSQVFATGRLTGQFPVDLLNYLVPEGFQNYFLNVSKATGEVSSSYWPGFAILLTPFTWLGIPWACNPVLSGLTVIVMNRLARQLFGSLEAAGLVTLLTLASPVFFGDGISYYSMTSHLLANALFTLLVLRPTPARLALAGLVGSLALTLHNPLPHMLYAVPWFAWLLLGEKPVARLAALCAGYLPLSLVLGVGWFIHSGHLTHDGGPVTGGVGSFENVANAFAWPTAVLFYARLVGLAKLLLWAAPCVLILAFWGGWRARADARFLALGGSAALTLVGYLFMWADQGHGWGFRYFHSAWLVLPIFATAVIYRPRSPDAPAADTTVDDDRADVRTYVLACALISVFAAVGLRAWQMREFMDNHLGQLPQYAGTEPRVVVIRGVGFYPHDLVQNDPYLRDARVMMIDLGEAETAAAIRRHFPDYHLVYRDLWGSVWSTAPVPARLRDAQ